MEEAIFYSVGNNSVMNGENHMSNTTSNTPGDIVRSFKYWSILFGLLALATLFGNSLVIMAVRKFKNLQSVTNYLIVSLAVADIMVGTAVMPLAVYVEVLEGYFLLPVKLCDIWIAFDVLSCTASILNMTAISIDRFAAIVYPIAYCNKFKKNQLYPFVMIGLCWFISFITAVPIALGVNNIENRPAQICTFHEPHFTVGSTIVSYVIPTMVMFILYSKILKVIRERATAKRGKQTKVKKTMSIKENHKELLFVKEPSSSSNGNDLKGTNSERPSTYHKQNNAKGKCLKNNFLSENHSPTLRNSSEEGDIMNTKEIPKLGSWHPQTDESVETFNGKIEPLYAEQSEHLCKHEYKTELNNNTSPHHRLVVSKSNYSKRDNHMANRKKSSKLLLLNNNLFQRVSFKKKDKPADRREQRAIITLVVVLIIFQVCWVPFFITNNVRAICEHLNSVRHVKMCTDIPDQLMSFFVWLGYINSMLNPVIYALLNVEYRKAFKQLLNCEEKKPRSANRL